MITFLLRLLSYGAAEFLCDRSFSSFNFAHLPIVLNKLINELLMSHETLCTSLNCCFLETK